MEVLADQIRWLKVSNLFATIMCVQCHFEENWLITNNLKAQEEEPITEIKICWLRKK